MCRLQVTRLLVDAVTISTANSEREHCFLPSHKGSPYHVHKLAERVLPAELLQVCSTSSNHACGSNGLCVLLPVLEQAINNAGDFFVWYLCSDCQHVIVPFQGPKSYNDALAKRFERKKGDMGSSSTGVKDRGIFVSADFRNPRTDQELQVQRQSFWHLFCIVFLHVLSRHPSC